MNPLLLFYLFLLFSYGEKWIILSKKKKEMNYCKIGCFRFWTEAKDTYIHWKTENCGWKYLWKYVEGKKICENMFKNWKLLFENIYENICEWKYVWKYV